MSMPQSRWGEGVNAEAIEAWDGPLFDTFLRFRHLLTDGLGAHGRVCMAVAAPERGERVLDVGCGFGDTTQDLAAAVGPEGEALGIDAAPRFVAAARADAQTAGVTNADFRVGDAQTDALGEGFDLAYSRMGTMFFTFPVPAMRNIRAALRPGGRLAMVVWRRREDNEWMFRAQQIVEGFVARPDEYDEPTCGPGPFSMAGADTTSEILVHAGFTEVALQRCDLPIQIGRDLDEAIDLVMSLGPAGEILRLSGDRAAHLHEPIDAALREALSEYRREDGSVWGPASTWIVTATAPA